MARHSAVSALPRAVRQPRPLPRRFSPPPTLCSRSGSLRWVTAHAHLHRFRASQRGMGNYPEDFARRLTRCSRSGSLRWVTAHAHLHRFRASQWGMGNCSEDSDPRACTRSSQAHSFLSFFFAFFFLSFFLRGGTLRPPLPLGIAGTPFYGAKRAFEPPLLGIPQSTHSPHGMQSPFPAQHLPGPKPGNLPLRCPAPDGISRWEKHGEHEGTSGVLVI